MDTTTDGRSGDAGEAVSRSGELARLLARWESLAPEECLQGRHGPGIYWLRARPVERGNGLPLVLGDGLALVHYGAVLATVIHHAYGRGYDLSLSAYPTPQRAVDSGVALATCQVQRGCVGRSHRTLLDPGHRDDALPRLVLASLTAYLDAVEQAR